MHSLIIMNKATTKTTNKQTNKQRKKKRGGEEEEEKEEDIRFRNSVTYTVWSHWHSHSCTARLQEIKLALGTVLLDQVGTLGWMSGLSDEDGKHVDPFFFFFFFFSLAVHMKDHNAFRNRRAKMSLATLTKLIYNSHCIATSKHSNITYTGGLPGYCRWERLL